MSAASRQIKYAPGAALPGSEVLNRARVFLNAHSVGVLGTVQNGLPTGNAVDYVTEGVTPYLLSEPSQKLMNIIRNAGVCFTVYTEEQNEPDVKEVSLQGDAEVFESSFLTRATELSNHPWLRKIEGLRHAKNMDLNTVKLVKFTPQIIKIVDFSLPAKGFATIQRVKLKKQVFVDNLGGSTNLKK
jgi:hypothetical protein